MSHEQLSQEGDLWVFAYGSLMWRPDFDYVEVQTAVLYGWHRSMCILSHHYRGTPERPGLVLGLDRGGSCRGRAFRIDAARREAVIAYLYEREMITNAYIPRYLAVRLGDGRRLPALTFVVDREHGQYLRPNSPEQAAAMIRASCGKMGKCRDYLANTVAHLDSMGLREGALHRLLKLVDAPDGAEG
ncbi:gamma-glutamylcyclotransferase [Telmatospirillum sp. J64-1]|uniref:gamma-glutamylcyclotransferase n=1 Tax=Telmatospirillum sp. J64-1 TaxID=2502183 RepID=UPI002106CDB8|nr:gamma-glutamylcyclotransferase [Telmatospirillum sp. J64-1]